METSSYLIIRRPHLIRLTALVLIALTMTACFLDRSGLGLPPTEFEVIPANICPRDPITVRWAVSTREPCWTGRPNVDGRPRCTTINEAMSDNPETPLTISLDERVGEISYDPGPSVDTTFSFTAIFFTREGSAREDLTASVNVIDVPTNIPGTAPGLCNDNGIIDVTALMSACVEINEICINTTNADGSYVLTGWTSDAVGSASTFMSEPLRPGECITPSDVGLSSFQDLAVVDVAQQVDPFDPSGLDTRPGDCTVEGSGYNDDISIDFHTSCSGAYPGCEMGMGGGGEDEPTPVPTATGSDKQDNDKPQDDLCADEGGVQFQGEVCVCSGYIDKVTICQDGTKYDNVTDQQCSPDPQECQQDDGKPDNGGGQTCNQQSCGNGTCEANCNENANSCPADCP